jgi:NAD(P) transhydrogenase subunit alpha
MNPTEKLLQTIDSLKEMVGGLESQVRDMTTPVVETVTANGSTMGLTLFVFALAIFLGVELIAKVPSQLHTPLMSGSNAISGITIVGALIALQRVEGPAVVVLGFLAVITATINVVGGYLVTDRMLGMFKTKKEEK